MQSSPLIRIILDIVIVVALLQGWWFVALPLLLIGLWRFPYYIELLLAGLAYDSLFGMVVGGGWSSYIGLILACSMYVLALGLRIIMR